ncbi:MAG: hypothetical protein ACQEST_11085 [Bacteroidota bacterium]
MTTLKQTYRLAAFFTLLLFSVNLIGPAGAAAISLHCDMDTEAHSMHDCCEDSEMDHHDKSEAADDCMMLSFCEQTVQSSQSDIPAVIQLAKSVVAVPIADVIEVLPEENDHPELFKSESASTYDSPPLFLLNSVFLN